MMQATKVTWEHIPVFNNSTSLSSNTTQTNGPFIPCSTNAFSNQITLTQNLTPYSSFTGYFVAPVVNVNGPLKSIVTPVVTAVSPPASASTAVSDSTDAKSAEGDAKDEQGDGAEADKMAADTAPDNTATLPSSSSSSSESKQESSSASTTSGAATAAAKTKPATQFAGVFKDRNKWLAVLEVPIESLSSSDTSYNIQNQVKNKQILLGRFDTAEEAKLVYKKVIS